ncbi:DNA mismatch repair protein MutT [marine bacterium AO1-C]|nr:DNA mismatch repair protein MutT [marine bacterium AO1-C]
MYENPWIRVSEDMVVNPSNKPGIYGTIHFKNLAIGIIPIDEEGNTYLVGQYRYPLDIYSWEIPMGGGNHANDPLESAKRELQEETGFTANKWTEIAKVHTSNSVTDEEGIVYIAEELQAGETNFDETEDLQVKKVSLAEAVEMVMNNEITDSISMIGLLKVARLRNLK